MIVLQISNKSFVESLHAVFNSWSISRSSLSLRLRNYFEGLSRSKNVILDATIGMLFTYND